MINLENWDQTKQYDRLGLDEEKMKIIDTQCDENYDTCSSRKKLSGYF